MRDLNLSFIKQELKLVRLVGIALMGIFGFCRFEFNNLRCGSRFDRLCFLGVNGLSWLLDKFLFFYMLGFGLRW